MRKVSDRRGVVVGTKSVLYKKRLRYRNRIPLHIVKKPANHVALRLLCVSILLRNGVIKMTWFFSLFSDSSKELKKLPSLTTTAVLIAAYVVLESFTINVGTVMKINFSFLALALIGALFGPVVSCLSAIICDVLGYLVSPMGGFIPVFMVVALVEGFIYGVFLYRLSSKNSIKKVLSVIFARTSSVIICNLFLNTFLLYLYKFIALTPAMINLRIIKNAVMIIPETIMLAIIVIPISIVYKTVFNKGEINKRALNEDISKS